MVRLKYFYNVERMNKKYVPDSLSKSNKAKQIKSIKEGKDRPNVEYKTRRSSYVVSFEKKYKVPITDLQYIYKNIISKTGVDKILEKGQGAYYSAGSRPNVSKEQWAFARLASVIMGGKARDVDKDIWNKYKK